MLNQKMATCGLVALIFSFANSNVTTAQDLLDRIGNAGSKIQEGIKVKPPTLDQRSRPDLKFRADGELQNRVNESFRLQLGDLGSQINQRLNLDTKGDIGIALNGANGLTVHSIQEGSLANEFGLRRGDRILAVDETWVRNNTDVSTNLKTQLRQNGYAWLYVYRDGQEQWVKLGSQIQTQPTVGMRIQNSDDGVKIIRVTPSSPAAEAGLQVNDIIVAVNNEDVSSDEQVISQIRSTDADSNVEFKIRRNGRTMTIESGVNMPQLDERAADQLDNQDAVINKTQQAFVRLKKEFEVFAGTQNDRDAKAIQDVQAKINDMASELAVLRNAENDDLEQSRSATIRSMSQIKTDIEALSKTRDEAAQRRLSTISRQIDNLIASLEASGSANASGSVNIDQTDSDK